MSFRKTIGHLTLDKPAISRITYDCAAWFMDVKLEPGTYEVFAYFRSTDDYEHASSCGLTYIEADGVVVDDCFTPLWGGVPIPNTKSRSHVGQRHRTTEFPGGHGLSEIVYTPEYRECIARGKARFDAFLASPEGAMIKALMAAAQSREEKRE